MRAPAPVRRPLLPTVLSSLRAWIGVELDEVSHKEKLVATLGGALSILGILAVTHHALGYEGAPMLIASMGASAVLLFAVPHGQLSQPWPVLAGHLLGALIGVTCGKAIGNVELAAACAVGLTIGAMHQLRAIHPPGGATALTAVVGGPAVRSLGYSFAWHPVLLNGLVIVAVAVVFNAAFPWRRYPAHFGRPRRSAPAAPEVSHEAIVAAMRSLDTFVDVTEEDIALLYDAIRRRAAG